jgi:hypothetical protein
LFNIEKTGLFLRRKRLVADRQLTSSDFRNIAGKLEISPFSARKVGLVAARQAEAAERVETRWNGTETRNTASPGDWIVTNLSADSEILRDNAGNPNMYVITADNFARLYSPADGHTPHGKIYAPRIVVEALRLNGGFDIMAPWGEMQRSHDGYLLLNGHEVYGNDRETFEATYAAT